MVKNFILKELNVNQLLLGLSLFFLPISIQLNSICLILFFIYNTYLRIRERSLFGLNLLFAFIFSIQSISFFLSSNYVEASKKLILFLVFPLLFSFFPRKQINVDLVFRYLLCGVVLMLVYTFLRSAYDIIFLNQRYDYGRGPEILLRYTPHHVYLSLFVITTIIVLINQIGRNLISFTNIYIVPFLFITLFLLPSRTALLIAIIIIPLCTIIFLKGKYSFKHIIIFTTILLLVSIIGLSIDFTRDKLLYAYYELFNVPTAEKPFYGITSRQKIWETCFNLINRTPLLGFGIGDTQEVLNAAYLKNGFTDVVNLNAHNQYLQNILQYGLLLSSIIVFIFLWIILKLIMYKEWLLVWLWIIILLFFATESMLNRQWGVAYFAMLLFLSCYRLNLEGSSKMS